VQFRTSESIIRAQNFWGGKVPSHRGGTSRSEITAHIYLTRRRGAHMAHTQVGRADGLHTRHVPSRENTHNPAHNAQTNTQSTFSAYMISAYDGTRCEVSGKQRRDAFENTPKRRGCKRQYARASGRASVRPALGFLSHDRS
jgi:hypothetical protein